MTRPACLILALAAALAGCAGSYAPTPRMKALQASMDKAKAAGVLARAMTPSATAAGLCKAPFAYDDPRPSATPDAYSVQAYRRGEEIGRKKEKDYKGVESTVVMYRKDRYVEERRFAELRKIRLTREAAGMCAGPVPRGQAALTFHDGRIEAPVVFAVAPADLDEVLAALSVLAPQAPIVEGTGL